MKNVRVVMLAVCSGLIGIGYVGETRAADPNVVRPLANKIDETAKATEGLLRAFEGLQGSKDVKLHLAIIRNEAGFTANRGNLTDPKVLLDLKIRVNKLRQATRDLAKLGESFGRQSTERKIVESARTLRRNAASIEADAVKLLRELEK